MVTVEINGTLLDVEFVYHPPERGLREHGLSIEPDIDEEVEILAVYVHDMTIDIFQFLSPETITRIETEILNDKPEYIYPEVI